MSNTDFDPDAYLSGPAATPAPPPAAPAATPAPKQDSGFDPNAYLAQPAGGFDPDAYLKSAPTGNAITDIWPEEKRAATDTWQSVKAGLGPENTEQAVKESQSTPFWDLTPAINSTLRTGRAIGSALAYPFQAAVGAPARSLVGHPLASAEQALGTNIDPQKFKSLIDAGVPKDEAVARATETPQQSYERWRGNVDTALSAIKPAGAPVVSAQGIGWRGPPVKPTPAPTPPVEGPFGVTLSQGEEANDLAARVREHNFLREGSAGAQLFREQREAQLSAAPERGAAALDTTNQVIANSPQTAADIVTSGLTQHQDVVDKLISTSEQALNGMHEANRTALSPTGTVLAQNPMDAANIIQGSVANEADRIQQAKSAAYAALDDSGTQFHPAAFNNAADKIRTMVEKSEKVDINPDSTPIANRVLDKLDSIVQDITQQRDPDTGRILTSDPITPSSLEEVRKRLNVFMGEARASAQMGKPSDAIAMRGIIDAWDGLIEDRIVKGTVTQGNPLDALSQMRYARGLNTVYRQTFTPRGPGDDVGQAIQKILGRYEGSAATPEQIQGMMYSPTNPLAVRIAGRLKQMFTSNSPEFGAAKQGLYSTITERPPGAPKWEPEDVADRIDQFTKGQGRSLTQAYLEPDEIAQLQDFGKRLRAHANATELAENPFEGVDFTQVFRRAVNGDQKAVKQLEDATSRLQAVGGPNSPHALALKQGLFLQGIQPVPGVAKWGPKTIGDNLSSLLASTRNSPLYSPAQRGVVQSYVDLMRKIQEPAGIRAPSEPAVRRALSVVGYRTGQIIGALIGRAVTPGIPLIGEFAGITVGGKLERAMEAATLGRVKKQLPILSEQLDRYQKAYTAWQRHQNTGTQKLFGVATSNLANGLHNWGINWTQLPLGLPGTAPAQSNQNQQRAAGGGVQDSDDQDNQDNSANYVTRRTAPFPEKPEGYEYIEATHPDVGDTPAVAPSAPQSSVETLNGSGLGHPSGLVGKGPEQASEGESAPPEAQPPPIESVPGVGAVPASSDTDYGNKPVNRLLGAGGEERYQTWPERMIRSGTTLAGDVMSGQTPIVDPVTGHTSDEVIQRAQDMAALAGGAGMPSAEEGALGMAGGKARQSFGEGWFYNPEQREFHKIDEGALGPHGDHDGWITIGENAERIGVDPKAAGAMQTATWGPFPDSTNPYVKQFIEEAPGLKEAIAADPVWGGSNWFDEEFNTPQSESAFKKVFGLPSYAANDPDLLNLVRIRKWPSGVLGIDTAGAVKNPKQFAADFAYKNPSALEGVKKVNIEHEGNYQDISVGDFLDGKWGQKPSGSKTAMFRSDTQQPGTALSALEHTQPFYSAVEQAITNAPQQKMHGSQWFNWLKNQPGIKQEELDWLGLKDSPDLQGLQTKQQMLDHVQGQGVGLKEVEKGGPNLDDDALGEEADRVLHQWQGTLPELADVQRRGNLSVALDRRGNVLGVGNTAEEARTVAQNNLREIRTQDPDTLFEISQEAADNNLRLFSGGTKYADYQLPGGDNYRELLLTMPHKNPLAIEGPIATRYRVVDRNTGEMVGHFGTREAAQAKIDALAPWAQGVADRQGSTYRSSHWDEPNVLAHMRMNDRDIPGVGKSLHLEELQSDWHQQGRKLGYNIQPKMEDFRAVKGKGNFYSILDKSGQHMSDAPGRTANEALKNFWEENQDKFSEMQGNKISAIPDAPFKQSWPDLLLKRAITKAAQEGKDAVSWTPGEQQAARYDLSKHIKELQVEKKPGTAGYVIDAVDHNGNSHSIADYTTPIAKLPDLVGKDLAEKITKDIPTSGEKTYSGLDLKVGGSGMKSFYDKMLVDKANAIGKKYGAKVEWNNLPKDKLALDDVKTILTGEGITPKDWHSLSAVGQQRLASKYNVKPPSLKVPVLRLTPQLKQQALTRGMPLFSDTSKPGAALSGLEKQPTTLPDFVGTKYATGIHTVSAPLNLKVYRTGNLQDAGRGIFFGDSAESIAPYSSIHNDAPVKEYTVTPNKTLIAESPFQLHKELFNGKSFQDAVWLEDKKSGFKSSVLASRKVESKMAAALKRKGYDALIYTKPPAPAQHEISIFNPKAISKSRAFGGSVKTQSNQQQIPRPISHQQNNSQPQHLQGFAAGGRVDPTQINRNPSAAQIKSGTYSKDHIHLHGLAVTIENAKGSTRSGVDKNGRQWTSALPSHYGYIKKTVGSDSDHLDVYLGPHTKAPHVFIIDQLDKDTKKWDEHKIGLGFGSKNQFVQTYKRAFSDGKASARIGAVHSMTLSQFKSWLEHGDTTVPYKEPEHKKLSHKFVGYEPIAAKPNRHCGVCRYFISAEHNGPACTLVENPIDPGAWCRRFRRKT